MDQIQDLVEERNLLMKAQNIFVVMVFYFFSEFLSLFLFLNGY